MAVVPSQTPTDPSNGNGGPKPAVNLDLIDEAEHIRNLLHEAMTRLGRVIAVLKQQRRQSRAVQAAVASLRQLQVDH